METDGSGKVAVAARANNGTNRDYLTILYDGASGVEDRGAVYDNGGDDVVVEIAMGGAGKVVITGWSDGTGLDYATLKYAP